MEWRSSRSHGINASHLGLCVRPPSELSEWHLAWRGAHCPCLCGSGRGEEGGEVHLAGRLHGAPAACPHIRKCMRACAPEHELWRGWCVPACAWSAVDNARAKGPRGTCGLCSHRCYRTRLEVLLPDHVFCSRSCFLACRSSRCSTWGQAAGSGRKTAWDGVHMVAVTGGFVRIARWEARGYMGTARVK